MTGFCHPETHSGDGNDIIANTEQGMDVLVFEDITFAEISFMVVGNDVVVDTEAGAGQITLRDWLLGDTVDIIEDATGTTMTQYEINIALGL